MKKARADKVQTGENDMRAEYDFSSGARGKHCRALQNGYTITVHNADGTTTVKDVMPKENAILLEPDVQAHFPDSESVNEALRCLIPLLSRKNRTGAKRR